MNTEKTAAPSGRIVSIDLLRCIAIIGMVLSANIGYFSNLPGWMFHAQTPPPTYEFNPDTPGITWVDLVFPFFLLSMGAALPFSMRRKLDRGTGTPAVCGGLLKRWAVLTMFALVLGNGYRIGQGTQPEWAKALFRMLLWVSLFLSLVRLRPSKKWAGVVVNLLGIALVAGCAAMLKFVFGVPLTTDNDIIIMILAMSSLFGGLLWLGTRNSLKLRWLCIALVAAVKAVSSYTPQALSFIPEVPPAIGWCFQWSFLQYVIPVLAGSVVGDMILAFRNNPPNEGQSESSGTNDESSQTFASEEKWSWIPAPVIAVAAVFVQLWGLYNRHVIADFCISAALSGAFLAVTRRSQETVWAKIGKIGFLLTLAGIMFDPLDGGIAKDFCNLSYLFTTAGMGTLVVSALLGMELNVGFRSAGLSRNQSGGRESSTGCFVGFLSGVGQNPMVAYTVTGFVIGPLLSLTGAMSLLSDLASGSPFWGVMQGILLTVLMMLATWLCTRLRLFWRS